MSHVITRLFKGLQTKLSKLYRFSMGKSNSSREFRIFFRDNYIEGYALTKLGRTYRTDKKSLVHQIHDIIIVVLIIGLFININFFGIWIILAIFIIGIENIAIILYNNQKNLLDMVGDNKYVSGHYRLKFDDSVEDANNATPVIKVGMLFFYRDEDASIEDLYRKISVEEGYTPREIHEATADDSLDISRYFLPVAITADMKIFPLTKPIEMITRILDYEKRHEKIARVFGQEFHLIMDVRKLYDLNDRKTNFDIYCDIGYISLQRRGSMILRIKRRGLADLLINSRDTSQVREVGPIREP